MQNTSDKTPKISRVQKPEYKRFSFFETRYFASCFIKYDVCNDGKNGVRLFCPADDLF